MLIGTCPHECTTTFKVFPVEMLQRIWLALPYQHDCAIERGVERSSDHRRALSAP